MTNVYADHPYADPGDGRSECDRCGRFVRPVIHSCKGVPVTEAAKRENRRRAELSKVAALGRISEDPAECAKWLARDEALTRGFTSPDGVL